MADDTDVELWPGATREERLAGLAPLGYLEERLAALAPQGYLGGLSPEALAQSAPTDFPTGYLPMEVVVVGRVVAKMNAHADGTAVLSEDEMYTFAEEVHQTAALIRDDDAVLADQLVTRLCVVRGMPEYPGAPGMPASAAVAMEHFVYPLYPGLAALRDADYETQLGHVERLVGEGQISDDLADAFRWGGDITPQLQDLSRADDRYEVDKIRRAIAKAIRLRWSDNPARTKRLGRAGLALAWHFGGANALLDAWSVTRDPKFLGVVLREQLTPESEEEISVRDDGAYARFWTREQYLHVAIPTEEVLRLILEGRLTSSNFMGIDHWNAALLRGLLDAGVPVASWPEEILKMAAWNTLKPETQRLVAANLDVVGRLLEAGVILQKGYSPVAQLAGALYVAGFAQGAEALASRIDFATEPTTRDLFWRFEPGLVEACLLGARRQIARGTLEGPEQFLKTLRIRTVLLPGQARLYRAAWDALRQAKKQARAEQRQAEEQARAEQLRTDVQRLVEEAKEALAMGRTDAAELVDAAQRAAEPVPDPALHAEIAELQIVTAETPEAARPHWKELAEIHEHHDLDPIPYTPRELRALRDGADRAGHPVIAEHYAQRLVAHKKLGTNDRADALLDLLERVEHIQGSGLDQGLVLSALEEIVASPALKPWRAADIYMKLGEVALRQPVGLGADEARQAFASAREAAVRANDTTRLLAAQAMLRSLESAGVAPPGPTLGHAST